VNIVGVGAPSLTMSMWMPLCGQTWFATAASFVGMWVVMMAAMMLPSLAPALWRYRRTLGGTRATRAVALTLLVATAYFGVWTVLGMAAFPLGAAVSSAEMRLPLLARAMPIAVGAVVLMAGALQFTRWKARQLACCRKTPRLPAHAGAAWRYGLRLGMRCVGCCANLTAVLLVVGVMDLRAMAAMTAAITVERLAPAAERAAQVTGAVLVCAGSWLIVRAVRIG
jgi:predicted metal-binding membrane protein